MQIRGVDNNNSIHFRYSHPLKTLYKQNKLKIKYGFYGEKLEKESTTIEHLKCVKYGGKTTYDNIVLTSANKNMARGIRPLKDVIKWGNVTRYLNQFKDIKLKGFDGNKYIQGILNTINNLIKQ